MKEVWIDVTGYEGLYKVSNIGRVSSTRRGTNRGGILKQTLGAHYLLVNLCKNGISKTTTVHSLVATEFIPNPDNLPQVNHKKGIKTDNRASELEWVSVSRNQIHRFEELGHVPYNRFLSIQDVRSIRQATKYHGYRSDLAKQFKTSVDVIENIRMGRSYKTFIKQLETK